MSAEHILIDGPLVVDFAIGVAQQGRLVDANDEGEGIRLRRFCFSGSHGRRLRVRNCGRLRRVGFLSIHRADLQRGDEYRGEKQDDKTGDAEESDRRACWFHNVQPWQEAEVRQRRNRD